MKFLRLIPILFIFFGNYPYKNEVHAEIKNPKDIEMKINNIPGVLEYGLFVDLTDKVLVGKIEDNIPVVYSPSRAS